MSFEDVRSISALVGLLLFLAFFIGVLIWVFRPGSRRKYKDASKIPFQED